MVRIDFLVFGYRRVTLPEGEISRAASLLLRKGISLLLFDIETFLIKERDVEICEKLLSGFPSLRMSEPLGIYGAFSRFPYKRGLICGLVCSILLVILSSLPVWDVRVRGNEKIPESRVEEMLLECGFGIGSLWFKTDLSEVETKLLSVSDGISWVNVNRRGSVAYVEIIEMQPEDVEGGEAPLEYSNIVAEYDCVIEEITVKRGRCEVKIGDTVRRGEVLISGILPTEAGGGLCRAEGTVIGRINSTVSSEVDRSYLETVEKRQRLTAVTLKIFNFPINIFKTYGNDTEKCDIIKEIDSYSLFGRGKLPFEIERILSVERTGEMREYTDAELVSVVSERLETQLSVMLADCDLLMRKTFGEFTEGGYRMSSEIVYLTEVGKETEIEILP
jgi:similar to stage IV sporulation protein